MNKLMVIGNVVGPAQFRHTATGKRVGELRIAYNDRYFDKVQNQWKNKETIYLSVIAWEEKAAKLEAFAKGAKVFVSGALSIKEFDKKDGTKGQSIEVTPDAIHEIAKNGATSQVSDGAAAFNDQF